MTRHLRLLGAVVAALLFLAAGVTTWWQHRVVAGAEATWSASLPGDLEPATVPDDLELVDYDPERLLLATGDFAWTYRAVVLDRRTGSVRQSLTGNGLPVPGKGWGQEATRFFLVPGGVAHNAAGLLTFAPERGAGWQITEGLQRQGVIGIDRTAGVVAVWRCSGPDRCRVDGVALRDGTVRWSHETPWSQALPNARGGGIEQEWLGRTAAVPLRPYTRSGVNRWALVDVATGTTKVHIAASYPYTAGDDVLFFRSRGGCDLTVAVDGRTVRHVRWRGGRLPAGGCFMGGVDRPPSLLPGTAYVEVRNGRERTLVAVDLRTAARTTLPWQPTDECCKLGTLGYRSGPEMFVSPPQDGVVPVLDSRTGRVIARYDVSSEGIVVAGAGAVLTDDGASRWQRWFGGARSDASVTTVYGDRGTRRGGRLVLPAPAAHVYALDRDEALVVDGGRAWLLRS